FVSHDGLLAVPGLWPGDANRLTTPDTSGRQRLVNAGVAAGSGSWPGAQVFRAVDGEGHLVRLAGVVMIAEAAEQQLDRPPGLLLRVLVDRQGQDARR